MDLLLAVFLAVIAFGFAYYVGYSRGCKLTLEDEEKLAVVKALADKKVDRVFDIPAVRDNPKVQEYLQSQSKSVFPTPDNPVTTFKVEQAPMDEEELAMFNSTKRRLVPFVHEESAEYKTDDTEPTMDKFIHKPPTKGAKKCQKSKDLGKPEL